MRVLLTAGYGKSLYSLAVAESLRRAGAAPQLVLVGYPFSSARLRALIRTRGHRKVLSYLWNRGQYSSAEPMPLRSYAASLGVEGISLRRWCHRWGIKYAAVADINGQSSLRLVRHFRPTLTIYTGGGILSESFIHAADAPILNAHHGPLPEIRGMNACEWSLLLGCPVCVTIHRIDVGIDTGQPIERINVTASPTDSLQQLRERCAVVGIEGLVKWSKMALPVPHRPDNAAPAAAFPQYFTLAPALREVLELQLPVILQRAVA